MPNYAANSKRRRERLLAQGRCPRCGMADVAWLTGERKYQHCSACRRKQAAKTAKRWRARVAMTRMDRVCAQCQTRPIPLIGRWLICAKCKHDNRKARRALR